eukprot:6735107-Alexandrium_andersonii.AAC.1
MAAEVAAAAASPPGSAARPTAAPAATLAGARGLPGWNWRTWTFKRDGAGTARLAPRITGASGAAL